MQASSSVSIVVHANNKTLNCQLEPLYSNSPNAQILKDKILLLPACKYQESLLLLLGHLGLLNARLELK